MIIGILLIIFFIIVFFATIYSDMLLKIQFNEFPLSWIAQGRPCGMFFKPPKSSIFGFWKMSFTSTEEKYSWVKEHKKAESILKKYKFISKVLILYSLSIVPLLLFIKLIEC